MNYTANMFADFLKKLIILDKDCRSSIEASTKHLEARDTQESEEWMSVVNRASVKGKDKAGIFSTVTSEHKKRIDAAFSEDVGKKKAVCERLYKCQEGLELISKAESMILASGNGRASASSVEMTFDLNDFLNGQYDFCELALESLDRKKSKVSSVSVYSLFAQGKSVLAEEIKKLSSELENSCNSANATYHDIAVSTTQLLKRTWDSSQQIVPENNRLFSQERKSIVEKTNTLYHNSSASLINRLNSLVRAFCNRFSPKELLDEYCRIYSVEPSILNYECRTEIPEKIRVGYLEFKLSDLNLCEYTQSVLQKHYPFMCRGGKICIPYCAAFGAEFNYLFNYTGNYQSAVAKDACSLGMRMFTMFPPSKVKFTFIDPVKLGETFAMFTRLVDTDDRTSEVIGGKIWFSPADVEENLRIVTNHISNVTQRCLQGKYQNIFEYNRVAEQNAEPYHVLMLMDFPAGLSETALKHLEQIVSSGPKCGVFTIIYRSETQYAKMSERTYPIIKNIETEFQRFQYSNDGNTIQLNGVTVNGKPIQWTPVAAPAGEEMDKLIAILKKGIKESEKVVIGIEKVSNAETVDTTANGIRIPIGIHGANEVQYLTLGVGGSHHALIAGLTRMGKSSLLHTIILRALTQYSPDELQIYLVDFKRGVEFQIYADFILPSFRVVAIETEREFGSNILDALEREQKIRASLFKKNHVDKIEEYRECGKKMPRILVIMDEFQELFSNANDEIGKQSSIIMERIVRQGAAFGIHMILASQSYSNISGIDRSVFAQMAVRIVLKCSSTDANLLLDEGSNEIDQISTDDPGRAVYNSEAGNKKYNNHFRVAYIAPTQHRGMLKEVSDKTIRYASASTPTRILLSSIEDNHYSIFNQFQNYSLSDCPEVGRLYIGEPMSVSNNMIMDLPRKEHSNLLMVGNDTDKARNMFSFALLSLCINYRVRNQKAPERPFIHLLNCKPLDDSFFADIPKMLGQELLSQYIDYIPAANGGRIREILTQLSDRVESGMGTENDEYLFVFGYQRAEELKSETKRSSDEDIFTTFNLMQNTASTPEKSNYDMFKRIIESGAECGVHTIIWHDNFEAFYQNDKDFMSYFAHRIGFNMSDEEYQRFIGESSAAKMNDNNAIYYNRMMDNQRFRPYQAPDEDWLKKICKNLH